MQQSFSNSSREGDHPPNWGGGWGGDPDHGVIISYYVKAELLYMLVLCQQMPYWYICGLSSLLCDLHFLAA